MAASETGARLSEYPDRTTCTDLRISVTSSPADENRRPLPGKRLGCLPMVLGAAGLHLVRGFHIEQPGQAPAAALVSWFATATVSGFRTFAEALVNGEIAPEPAVAGARFGDRLSRVCAKR